MLLLQDTTRLAHNNQRQALIIGGLGMVIGGILLGFFFILTTRVERRFESSRTALLASEKRFRSLVESSSDWIWEVDAEGRYVYASPKVKDLLGYDPEEILGKTPFDLMPPDERELISREFATIVAERRQFTGLENRNLHKDGRTVEIESNGVPIFNEEGTLCGYRGIDRDITERKRAERALNKSTQRLNLHFQQTPLAVIEWDTDFRVLNWNPAAEAIFGYSREEAVGRHAMDLIIPESAKGHVSEVWEDLLKKGGGFRSTNENLTKAGNTIFCEWYNTPLVDDSGQVISVASLAQDVTEQKRAEQRLQYLAYYDDLTGLPNRTLFNDRLCQAMPAADRNEKLVGVLFMDLDHFKIVNDTLGHEVGDWLLRAVAARLKSCLRESDTIARLGGDEFAFVLTGVLNVEDVTLVAQKILDELKDVFVISGNELFITCSIGITLYPFDDTDIQKLFRNADSAMYHAKDLGRNTFQLYSAEMTARVEKRLAMETDLRHALERDEFLLHYQPQLDLSTGRIMGMEALIRWRHPEKGIVSPAEFIPVAEDTGLIVPIGEWILRTACAQAKAWQDHGLPNLIIAINLSARQFKDGRLVSQIKAVLEETGLDPRYVELEITESLLMEGGNSLIASMLDDLKGLGVKLAIDDFGTGYSSLSYLRHFPIDKLKIDQSFVRGMTSNAQDASLVSAIIAIARTLNFAVIAEGVETEEQLHYLRRDNCDFMQGYLFSSPLPAGEIATMVMSGKALRLTDG
jgi:diguanylate cyclase (GGDEF)-like protein/PAS domain S-box-containing protein